MIAFSDYFMWNWIVTEKDDWAVQIVIFIWRMWNPIKAIKSIKPNWIIQFTFKEEKIC